jgi:hypothetical protein
VVQRVRQGRAQVRLGRLLADSGHHQDVVLLAERHQESEQEERQHEVDARVAADVLEDDRRQAERRRL